MEDNNGTNKYDCLRIADVFAEFYEELYTSATTTRQRRQMQPTTTYDDAFHDARIPTTP